MSISGYRHWGEDAAAIWWREEGKHYDEPDPYDDEPHRTGAQYDAEDAFDLGYDDGDRGDEPDPSQINPRLAEAYMQGYADGKLNFEHKDDG